MDDAQPKAWGLLPDTGLRPSQKQARGVLE